MQNAIPHFCGSFHMDFMHIQRHVSFSPLLPNESHRRAFFGCLFLSLEQHILKITSIHFKPPRSWQDCRVFIPLSLYYNQSIFCRLNCRMFEIICHVEQCPRLSTLHLTFLHACKPICNIYLSQLLKCPSVNKAI